MRATTVSLAAILLPILAGACTRGSSGGGAPDASISNGGTCVVCHAGITSPHDRFSLRCTDCHGGDQTVAVPGSFRKRLLAGDPQVRTERGFQAILRAAHVTPTAAALDLFYANGVDDDGDGQVDEPGEFAQLAGSGRASDPAGDTIDSEFNEDLNYVRFLNPGDLRVAQASCGSRSPAARFLGQCHDAEVDSVRRSIMTTNAGVIDGAYYGNRALPGDPSPSPASNGDPRGGRFGFVLDWNHADSQFDPASNRFIGDNRIGPGSFAGLSTTTLDRSERKTARFPFGGNPLRFPNRALSALDPMPDRPIIETGSKLSETANAITGLSLQSGFGEQPVDSALYGFRAYHTHLVPSPGRNFVFAAFPDIPPNPFARGRGSGCTGCHMLYDADGHNREPRDPTVRENGRQVATSIADAIANRLDLEGEKFYPRIHKLTTRIPTEQCGLCHGFVTRVDQAFEGRFELAGGLENDRRILPLRFTTPRGQKVEVFSNLATVNGTLVVNDGEGEPHTANGILFLPDRVKRSESFDGRQLRIVYGGAEGTTRLRDAHLEAGMHCIDCHFIQDAHGDGNVYARNWDMIEIECEDCHGTPERLADLVTSGPNGGNDLRKARDVDGKPFFEIEKNGDRIQRSRVTPGLSWRIPQVKEAVTPGSKHYNPRAEAAMAVLATSGPFAGKNAHIAERGEQGRLECYACHNSWAPNCFSCHFQTNFDAAAAGDPRFDVGGVKGQRGIWIDREKRQGFTDFALFSYTRSPFILGRNGVTEGKKLSTFRSTMEVHASVSGPIANQPGGAGKNDTILDNLVFTTGVPHAGNDEIVSGVAMNMFMPHTVRKLETRDCESCHTLLDENGFVANNHILAGTFGYGTGRYQNLGDWLFVATDTGLRQVDFKKENGTAKNVWPGFVLSDVAPRVVSPTSDAALDVALVKNFTPPGEPPRGIDVAFLAEGPSGVRAIDVTGRDTPNYVPRAPVALSLAGPANALDHISPDLSDPRLYVAIGKVGSNDGGVEVVDASGYFGAPPALSAGPFITWSGADARDIVIAGDFAYVADGANGLAIVRIRGGSPALFVERSLSNNAVAAERLAVMDRFVYVAAGTAGLFVIDLGKDLSEPQPVEIASLSSIEAHAVALEGSKALVAGGSEGLHIVDVTTPGAPVLLRTIKTFNGTDSIADARDVVIGSVPLKIFAVVADAGANRVLIVNLTDPFDWRERLFDKAALDPHYKYSLERRDPMTPRDPDNADVTDPNDPVSGVLLFPLGTPPRRIAPGAALDRIADEGGRRLRESWQEGAGVIDPGLAARMRAVTVEETPGTNDLDDKSGNGLGPLRIK